MSIDRKTLVILTPGFPVNEQDSTCLPMQQQLVRSFKENYPELDIRILSFQYPYHKKEYTWSGLPVIPFSGRNKGGLLRLLLRKKIIASLEAIHGTHKISGILSFWYGECAYIGNRFADKTGIRHYCWILGQDAKKENKYPNRVRLESDELIALSDFVQDAFEKNHGVRPKYVVPPGIDGRQYSLAPGNRSIDILGVGSLIPLKQFQIVLEIVTEIKKHIPGIKAVLAGDGPEKPHLEQLKTRYGLEENLILTGELPHEGILKLMQESRILIHPSSYEGFGMVCLEGIAAGAHVISFVQPMNKDIPNWHITRSKEEMKEKAINILQDPATDYKGKVIFKMEDCVKSMMRIINNK